MNILFASSEVEPFSKTGGLADVAGALPCAIAAQGHNVLVVSPRYRNLRKSVKDRNGKIKVPIGKTEEVGELSEAVLPAGTGGADVPALFIGNKDYFDREELYSTTEGDYPDNYLRFAFFSRALLEAARAIDFQPDIIHLNDWQTAPAAVYLRTIMADDAFFASTRVLLTIHNLGYPGLYKRAVLKEIGLPVSLFDIEGLEFYGKISFLKGGMIFSDAINTVSRKYAYEIQTPAYGSRLDGVLRKRADRLFGILNGVDYSAWNPATDKLIATNYSAEDLSGKEVCKKDMLTEFGLPYIPSRPVVGMISRLAGQKGFDLIEEALADMMIRDMQLVILGTGQKKYHKFFESVMDKYPDKLGVKLAYDNTIAHKIEAGSDMFLMPSLYEPCGLNQMYSLKYGTVPIVRATGGLDDTVTEWDGKGKGIGFKFYDYYAGGMMESLDKGLKAYMNRKAWRKIVSNGMAENHSWKVSARSYIDLYTKMKSFQIAFPAFSLDTAHN